MTRAKARHELAKDVLYILVGVALAIFLSSGGFIDLIVRALGGQELASFAAGVFFTSAFTIAPASVALAHIGAHANILTVSLWGALGAMCGDLLLFLFIRDKFSKDLKEAFKPSLAKHIVSSFHIGFMKWLAPLIGAVIIASPLPDELGLALMGISKTKLFVLLPVSFVMNVIGVYAVVSFAQML
ncbi:MAG: hypothetical protein V4481_04015 [Patescibacteria group bacterium]